MKRYKLPRGYLSYSSMALWRGSKDKFRKKYYELDYQEINTPYINFGHSIAQTLEDSDKVQQHPVLSCIPRYDVSEYAIEHRIDGIMIKAFIDSYDPVGKRILEYKTGIRFNGKAPWDMVKVRKHEQLLLYSLLIHDMTGSVDPVTTLVWLETEWQKQTRTHSFRDLTFEYEKKELNLTGHFEVFERTIEPWEHRRYRQEIVQIASEISEDYKRWLKLSTAPS